MSTPNEIAAIYRAGAYSPNHIGNDAAILNAVAENLRLHGFTVTLYTEEQFIAGEVTQSIIVNMCRERRSIELLQKREREGATVVNSGFGIENCTRERMTRLLVDAGIPYPESLILDTTDTSAADRLVNAGFTRCWIKRGDFHAMHKEDVSFVRHPQEAADVLREYSMRGISRAVINRHLPGDLIKFYGVRGTDFFYWFYPFDAGHSKYGHEAINGHSRGLHFDLGHLLDICRRASEVLDVKVYGGDCIVDPDGSVRIIDFNDWPSFAPCRSEAAAPIADSIIQSINDRKK